MTERLRMKKFVIALDELLLNNEYYDEELQETVCEVSEDDAYNILMKNDEFHLLTSKVVKGLIHLFITDYRARVITLNQFKSL